MAIDLGRLRDTNLRDRPFVKGRAENQRGRFPFPLALILRRPCGDKRPSAVATKLFHALHYLSWNCLNRLDLELPLQAAGMELRRLIGHPNARGNGEIKKALDELQSLPFELPDLQTYPRWRRPEPLLESFGMEARTGRVRWRFSNGVVEWCQATTPYAWLELAVTSELRSRFDLRLYEVAAALVGRNRPEIRVTESDLRGLLGVRGCYPQSCEFRARVLESAVKRLSIAPFTMTVATESAARDRNADFLRLTVERKDNWRPTTKIDAEPLDLLLQFAIYRQGELERLAQGDGEELPFDQDHMLGHEQ